MWPPGKGPVPAIVVVHEWWGLNQQIRGIARRLSRQGYVAIVPDLYHGKVARDAEHAHELSRGLDSEAVITDLKSAIQWLRSQPRTAKTKVGVIGFCMGGGLSQALALSGADISAAVMFYGQPETDPAKLARLRVPLQGHFGADDEGIPSAKVKQLQSTLQKTGKTAEIYVYPGAGHAFMNEDRPSYHPDATRQAWARTLAFFQKHLKS
jgi:carboxymethylenebutenolidase